MVKSGFLSSSVSYYWHLTKKLYWFLPPIARANIKKLICQYVDIFWFNYLSFSLLALVDTINQVNTYRPPRIAPSTKHTTISCPTMIQVNVRGVCEKSPWVICIGATTPTPNSAPITMPCWRPAPAHMIERVKINTIIARAVPPKIGHIGVDLIFSALSPTNCIQVVPKSALWYQINQIANDATSATNMAIQLKVVASISAKRISISSKKV